MTQGKPTNNDNNDTNHSNNNNNDTNPNNNNDDDDDDYNNNHAAGGLLPNLKGAGGLGPVSVMDDAPQGFCAPLITHRKTMYRYY